MSTRTWNVPLPGYLGRGSVREYEFTTRSTPRGVCVERNGKRYYVRREPDGTYHCGCVDASCFVGCIHMRLARWHDQDERKEKDHVTADVSR